MTNGKIFYAVTAKFSDEGIAQEYIGWLESGHVKAVKRAGAISGDIVVIDRNESDDAIRVETLYVFGSRAEFKSYDKGPEARKLRADGMQRFGDRGVTFERRTGEVI
ncbi:MAG: DUF4286 family protein [Nanoarchaeota archaeon]|nr:DUF4286 family protein [Nanoarchaeota archaeon]